MGEIPTVCLAASGVQTETVVFNSSDSESDITVY